MTQTIQIQQFGGPEQMQMVDLPVGDPGPGEITSATTPSG